MIKNISDIIENNNISKEYIFLGTMIIWFILMIFIIVLYIKQHKLKKKYQSFMMGSDGISLERSISEKMSQADIFKEKYEFIENRIDNLENNIKYTFQKVGIVKYDAFNEMGGKLSFALALLTSNNDGMVVNSVHSREGCYVYIKEVTNGESFTMLADVEKEAVEQAIEYKIKL